MKLRECALYERDDETGKRIPDVSCVMGQQRENNGFERIINNSIYLQH
jgi:hypothetical protein